MNESGITVAFHGGDSGYGRYFADWGEGGDVESFKALPWKGAGGGRPRALRHLGGARLPRPVPALPAHLRVARIEMGCELGAVAAAEPQARVRHQARRPSPEDPVETFKRHVWVSPFHEDDVKRLRELLGADRLLMGSDWPHAEGLPEPIDYVRELAGFSPEDVRRIMRDNALALAQRRPVSQATT